ncbi:hypothetical protein A3A21_02300 [Candidatus Jorgensenbacteria bacterium RIFCSPLOWO2_01_FULL_45_25b]|uniref:PDZ domain-containing protein n=1 Tax=Candidatus Jorgensenbacteria bacterium RIFCSPLOWO2_01_FULL_45_25b TaxID=1798471 RepID=A0A1F6BZY9_9BACT|nr:MAG: hypothetical protein A3A21_02300 [Candidatus Jorgensenbacteria bacterium RIFCSPLOWO2_01_FULL_45_25b]
MKEKNIVNTLMKQKWIIFGGLIVIGGVFLGGVRFGSLYAPKEEKAYTALTTSSTPLDFTLLKEAISIAKEKYVHIDKVKEEDFLYGAVEGAIASVGDPYTTFFRPDDAKKFEEDIRGNFGGIGAEIGIRDKQLLIISPLKGNPAEALGLKAGDKILKIDDKTTQDITVEEAVKNIRGEIGTTVRLLIFREGWNDAKEFKITRAIINLPTLDLEMISLPGSEDKNIAYIQLHTFNGNATNLFYKAAFSALLQGTNGVVLDLRNNSGGYLDVAIDIAGWFMKKGEVVTKEKFRSGKTEQLIARGNGALKDIPVVVLVNEGSASASEILAGALRDNRGAKLIGEKTFGKGSVQELEKLRDGSTLKISIAEWLTPLGGSIDHVGLEPDVKIKPLEEKEESKKDEKKKEDVQLKKALEVLAPLVSKEKALPTIMLE